MTSIRYNVREKRYDFIPDDNEIITAQVGGEEVSLCNCPYCGKFHDMKEVSNTQGDLYGLAVFCSDDCKDTMLGEYGKFCKSCGCWLDKDDCHDVDGYDEYCHDCACEEKVAHDDWAAEQEHLKKCML